MNAEHLSGRRRLTVWTLIVLASVTALAASLTVWTKRQLLDGNQWTKSSSQLLADRNIRNVVSQKLVTVISRRTDVEQELRDSLPRKAQGIAPVAAVALQDVTVRSVDAFLGTSQAQTLWADANRTSHRTLVRILEGKKVGPVKTSDGAVVLDLGPLATKVVDQLGASRHLNLGNVSVSGRIVLVRADQLSTAQQAVRALRLLSIWLTVLAIVLYALAVFAARGHRRKTLEACGISLAVVGFVLLVGRRVVGDTIVNSFVATEAYRPAIRDAWLIETRLLADIAYAVIAYGAAAVAASILGGPSAAARSLRRLLLPLFRQRREVFPLAVLFILLAVLAWGPTLSGRRLLVTVLLALLALVGIELWRKQALSEEAAARPRRAPRKKTSG